MYPAVNNQVDFPAVEREILKQWDEHRIFEKAVKQSGREMVFYDGPPFPTGIPHLGTIFVSILKDSLARFFTMAGYSVPRRWGWDCHGLPIETAVEKQLGIHNKTEIEDRLSVRSFNDACRKLVADCNESWESYVRKIGRWVDYRNAYRTLDRSYMESVIWVFRQCYDKGLIYKDYRVTPYCFRCETSLSISDTRESDSTRPRQDPEVIVAFKALDDVAGKPTYYLAWTTTPWTLVSNEALAVGEAFAYIAFEHEGRVYIMAEALLDRVKNEFPGPRNVVKTFTGRELVGRRYEPLFPYFKDLAAEGYFRVLAADFVTLEDGVGVVHCAPAFGEDDYWLCKRNGIKAKNPVNGQGCFTADIPEYAGRNALDCNKDIIKRLKDEGKLLRHSTLEHNYPHCWRCRTPLMYRATDAWYFAVEKIKDRLLAHNEDIHWVPEHLKHGRFGKWLEGARDWNISRSRYWGTPIPVWECESAGCGERRVPGSVAELESLSGQSITDLHKEFLDPLVFKCPKCGGAMRRVSEVLDCWFESGSMPFGQCHYPFENKEWFEKHFPADFIVEYPGQIRGWFYYLHVLAVALLDRASFKNCLVHGTLLAADGGKISKSKKNFTDPMELIDRYGADALRLYLLNSPAVVMEDLDFKDEGVEDQVRGVLLPVWNAYSFFVTYANIDGYRGDPEACPEPAHPMDRWILAMLQDAVTGVTEAYRTFYLNHSVGPVVEFIDNLTNWYIRQSRVRFWGSAMTADKKSAYDTLFYVLIQLTKLLAPATPFIAEAIYKGLTGRESVHLAPWPDIPQNYRNDELREEVTLARTIASLGLALRQKAGIKVRQPLSALSVALPSGIREELLRRQMGMIAAELNVKEVRVIDNPSLLATIRAVPNAKVLGPRYGKDVQHIIRAAKAGQVREEGDKVVVFEGGREWTLDRADVSIAYQGKDGADVLSEKGIMVALDKTLTPELREEGLANELNRVIQDLRKEAGYQVSDRIQLHLDGPLPDRWKRHLAQLALADPTPLTAATADRWAEKEVEGVTFKVGIKKG